MDPLTIGLIGAGGAALGGILGYQGQRETNAAQINLANNANAINREEAAINRTFQADQATQQMAFQREMANSQHQREVEDLKKAGLNPILSVNSGASAPQGASASGAQATAQQAQLSNPNIHLTGMLNSALESMTLMNGLEKQAAETRNINAQTNLAVANTKKAGVETEASRKHIPESELKNDFYDMIRPLIKKVKSGLMSTSKPSKSNVKFYEEKFNPRMP